MEIRRSEVHFMDYNTNHACAARIARSRKKSSYVLLDAPNEWVFNSGWNGMAVGTRLCAVRDLIDDRPSPFPPLPDEPSSDTPTDRARDAALREVNR